MDPRPEHLNVMFSPTYAVPVFGYVVPSLAMIVLVTNIVMVWILRQRHMRSPANTLLICIAVSDTLAITLPICPFVYFYSLGFYRDYVPFAWCRVYFNLVHVFPLLCNMASLWATVALAFMRCYSVWRPLQAKSTITSFRTYMVIVAIYIVSTLVYVPAMFEYTYIPLSTPSMLEPNTTMVACHLRKTQTHLSETFCLTHTWIQILFTSLLPWFLITFPDFGLLWKLKKSDEERKTLNDQMVTDMGGKSEATEKFIKVRMAAGKRMTSWMIFLVVSMVWLVEIPFAISFTLYLSHSNSDVMRNELGTNVVFVFLLKYTAYPVVFLIYCFMSQKFRKTFREMVCRKMSGPLATNSYKQSSSTSKDQTGSALVNIRSSTSSAE